MTRLLFLLPLAFLVAQPVYAHTTGASFETQVNGYTIDSGYSSAAPQLGESVIFDFRLRKGTNDVPFDDVWVRVESEDKSVVFASGIHNSALGGSRMSYVFPRAGKYTISMRYENTSGPIVETEYPLTVIPSTASTAPDTSGFVKDAYGVGGFVLGAALMFFLRSKRLVKLAP